MSPPRGPFETERQAAETPAVRAVFDGFAAAPRVGQMTHLNHRMLDEACTAAGVELGAYDHRILVWLAGWEPTVCAVVAGWITRARDAAAADIAVVRDALADAIEFQTAIAGAYRSGADYLFGEPDPEHADRGDIGDGLGGDHAQALAKVRGYQRLDARLAAAEEQS